MKPNFRIRLITTLVILGLLIVGCGPAKTPAPTAAPTVATVLPTSMPTATSAPTAAPSPTQGQPVVITLATAGVQSDEDLVNASLKGLKAKYPNITVQIQLLGYDEYNDKMLTEVAAGTAPDLFSVGDDVAGSFLEKGAFLDISPYISNPDPNIGIDVSKFYPNIYNIGVYKGQTYLLTSGHSDLATHINTTMFDTAGIPYPKEGWTYDDLINICQQLTLDVNGNNATSPDFDPKHVKQWGADQASPYSDYYRFLTPFIYAFGGTTISPDGTKASGYMDSVQTTAGLQYYSDLIHKYHCVPSANTVTALGGVDLFAGGLSAIKLNWGPWNQTQYQSTPNLKLAVVPLPTGPAGHKGATCWAGYGVYAGTKHPLEAYLVLREIGTEPGLIAHASTDLASMPSVDEQMGKSTDPYWSQFVKEIPFAQPPEEFRNSKFTECINTPLTSEVLDKIVADDGGSFDIHSALTTLAKQADACLAKK